jgi:hypothetical protein
MCLSGAIPRDARPSILSGEAAAEPAFRSSVGFSALRLTWPDLTNPDSSDVWVMASPLADFVAFKPIEASIIRGWDDYFILHLRSGSIREHSRGRSRKILPVVSDHSLHQTTQEGLVPTFQTNLKSRFYIWGSFLEAYLSPNFTRPTPCVFQQLLHAISYRP